MTTAVESDNRDVAAHETKLPRIVPTLSRTEPGICRQAVAHVLSSQTFFKAARLSSLLEYICRLELEGRGAELSEVAIGVAVFERRENYNTSDDNIVRSTMRLLRQRLDTYYAGEGRSESIRIEIPRGTYVPLFKEQAVEPASMQEEVFTAGSASSITATPNGEKVRYSSSFRFRIAVALAVLFAVSAGLFGYRVWRISHSSPSDRFWKLLLPPNQATLLVPADTILMLYERASHHAVPLKQYLNGNFADEGVDLNARAKTFLEDLHNGRYTAITSVGMATDLSHMDKSGTNHLHVKFCRDLQLNDLKQSNVILVGAEQNNPWISLFRPRLNFHLDWDSVQDRFHILNDHPLSGEPPEWNWSRGDANHRGFGQIAFLHNLGQSGYVLIIAGTSMDGTRAASEFLFDPQRIDPILKQVEQNGKYFGEFEVLLQAKIFDHGTLGSKVLGIRYHPQSTN